MVVPLVVVCVNEPVLVHVTVSPTAIVTFCGVKPKSMMFTLVVAAQTPKGADTTVRQRLPHRIRLCALISVPPFRFVSPRDAV